MGNTPGEGRHRATLYRKELRNKYETHLLMAHQPCPRLSFNQLTQQQVPISIADVNQQSISKCGMLTLPRVVEDVVFLSTSVPHSFTFPQTVHLPIAAKSLQSYPTLCDPIDGSPPESPSLGFSRQEHWRGLPFPSPMHEGEK